jgi:glucose-6-phosphate-specific signal transduction histidine kinase
MGEKTRHRGWIRQWLVCASYALCYALLRYVSVSNWNLPAGLRLACLLLAPYRYWPALIAGEFIPLAYHAWDYRDELGWRWAVGAAVPPILPLAAVVAWGRQRARLFRDGQQVSLALLLGTMLAGAVLTAIGNTIVLAAVQLPGGGITPVIDATVMFNYFLGNYLGALAVAPPAIVLYLWLTERTGSAPWSSRLGRDCLIGGLLPMLVLLGLAYTSQGDSMQVFRIAMFLPVVWLTSRHGWQGAALGGSMASFAVTFTSSMLRDPAVIQAQALIALAVSTLLMLGSRIAHQDHSARASRVDSLRGFQLAQQGLYLEELRLRQAADALEHLGRHIRDNHERLLDRLRHTLPANEEHSYARQAVLAQHEMHRLANALYPRGWRERGVPATLRDGPFAQAVRATGASYACELSGRGLSQLAPDVHMTLYRLACEVVVHILSGGCTRQVRLQLRGGHTGGRRWVVMRIVGDRGPASDDAAGTQTDSWRQAMTLLGASGLGMATIRDRAQIYGGQVHQREQAEASCITLLLHDSLRAVSLNRGAPA